VAGGLADGRRNTTNVNLQEIVQHLYADSLASIDLLFRPELTLCAAIVLILLLKIIGPTSRIDSFYVALFGSALALWWALPQNVPSSYEPGFTGLLAYDGFSVFIRAAVMLFTFLFCIFTRISGIPDREAGPDVYVLVLGASLGMCLMATANHLLMVFLGVEMASVPSYALAGMLKGRRKSSEAALKYAVYGAGTAGVMLYGISLLAGLLGSVHLPTMAVRLGELLSGPSLSGGTQMVLALAALMVMVGLAFKLSAVPFHFWCPDVFEGATAEVDAFLSVASKAAALGLLVRVALALTYIPAHSDDKLATSAQASAAPAAAIQQEIEQPVAASTAKVPAQAVAFQAAADAPVSTNEVTIKALRPAREFVAKLLAFIAVITCTFGNLAAYGQTNIKRLLAYSTIAHAGYMMMPVAAALLLVEDHPQRAETAIAALAFYVGVYLFMNLGAFAVIAFLRNVLRSEEIADYAGLIRRMPIVTICFCTMLVSLIGLPPLAGFAGKFLIFAALVDAKLWTVLVIAGLNTAISLFYYLRVVKIMTIDPEPESRLPASIALIPGTFVVLLTVPVIVLGVWWDNLNLWANAAAAHLF
jgi:NADH-quinone oxidoreductase subunit N